MSFLVVLPVIDREISERCVRRLDLSRVLVVDNSVEGFASSWDAEVVRPERNLGVPRSWNLGYDRVMADGLDHLMLLSAATEFAPGSFDRLAALLEDEEGPWRLGLQTQEGWHLLALGRPLLEACGRFDANFYPAYFEDLDYLRRMELSGLWHPADKPLPQVTIEASRWGDAHGMTRSGVGVHFTALLGYYRSKWGGPPREEEWGLPFGDQPLGYWPEATVEELAGRYGIPAPAFSSDPVARLLGRT